MKRVLKITALIALLTTVMLAALMTWLVNSEQGSRWLLQQGLGFVPVTIEAVGISGTLADGLSLENLSIALPSAEIRAAQIVLSWSPASLLAGAVNIDSAHIAELSIDIAKNENSEGSSADSRDKPVDEKLFWLDFPLQIYVESGHLDKLRIDEAEFENLDLSASIGHNLLQIKRLEAQAYGTRLQFNGELLGPDPGRLEATANWQIPAENLSGSGSFSGDIEKLSFNHVINVPEVVNFSGTIFDLFTGPSLSGVADWPSIRLPGETVVYSKAGNITVSSDFRSARLKGNNIVLLEGWPQAPMQLEALVDLQAITIDSYSLAALGGQVTGLGRIAYSDGLQGQLVINAKQIDTGLINSELPGRLGFDSSLQIESADIFAINVSSAKAKISDKDLSGTGYAQWHGGNLTAINGNINAGTNQLSAEVKLGKQLSGTINANAPELVMLWPGLQGALKTSIIISGSPKQPQARLTAQASSVSFGSQSLDTFSLAGELQGNSKLAVNLTASGLVTGKQQLGKLDFSLAGKLTDFQSTVKLSGGGVDVELRASGGWQDNYLTQSFEYGEIRPDGFASWQLQQNPKLRLSTDGGQLSPHCWKQQQAGICIGASNWSADNSHSTVAINDFALATLNPLLAQGYSIDGTVDADLKLNANTAGLQGELHWRQSDTLLRYADDIDKFQTLLDEVKIDLLSDGTQTNFAANLTGEQGLNISATANVNGPLIDESPLQATAKGRLPSIALLRPLLQRVLNSGELQGELTIDLTAGGTLNQPVFTGGANLSDGSLGLLGAGITLSEINITAQSKAADKLLVTGELRSGDGRAKIFGEVQATDKTGLLADIHIQGENLASVRLPNLSVDSSPDLTLRISEDMFDISGTIKIPLASAEIRKLPRNAVPRSADVIVHTPDRGLEQQSGTIVTGDVAVILGEQVRFNGFGLSSRLDGRLKLTQSRGGFLRSSGTVRVRDGFLTGYGKELRVDRGELTFIGPLDDPLINIQVSRESIYEGRQYIIGLRLTGSAQHVKTEPFSRPAMSENDVLVFLMLDRPAGTDDDASGAALALGLQQLVPVEGGSLGLDEVSFETNDANEAAMVAGKRINDKLYVRYVFGTLGQPGAFRIRYRLGRGFSLESSTGARQSLDLIYLFER